MDQLTNEYALGQEKKSDWYSVMKVAGVQGARAKYSTLTYML